MADKIVDPTQQLHYLYCIFRENTTQRFTTKGMGERGDLVSSLHYRDLGAVISYSQVDEYDASRRNMLNHTKVLEEVMTRYSILPIRFNTIAPNQEAVYQLLRDRYDELQQVLGGVMGKVEMGLKALWYEGVAFEQILAERDDIRNLRNSLQNRPPESTYYDRIRLGEMVEKALTNKRERESEAILTPLRSVVSDVQISPNIGERMIVNASFLVEQAKEPMLDAAIRSLDEQLGSSILFRYVGPLPPYNFVNLSLTWRK